MRSGRVIGLAVAWLAWAGVASASVYKCAGVGGQPIYQDDPCPAGKQLRSFDDDPPNLSIIPGNPAKGSVTPSAGAPAPAAGSSERDRGGKGRKTQPPADAGERRHAHAGMTEGQVLARLGHPDITAGGSRKQGGVRWTYLPASGDEETITTLWFTGGVVTEVERKLSKR